MPSLLPHPRQYCGRGLTYSVMGLEATLPAHFSPLPPPSTSVWESLSLRKAGKLERALSLGLALQMPASEVARIRRSQSLLRAASFWSSSGTLMGCLCSGEVGGGVAPHRQACKEGVGPHSSRSSMEQGKCHPRSTCIQGSIRTAHSEGHSEL